MEINICNYVEFLGKNYWGTISMAIVGVLLQTVKDAIKVYKMEIQKK